jgi:hypothetical protein
MRSRALLLTYALLFGAAARAEEPLPAGALHRIAPLRGTPTFAFAPSGKSIAVADESGRIDLYSVATRKVLTTLRPDGPAVGAIEFAPGGSMLVVAAAGDKVRLLDPASGRELRALDGGAALGLAFSPDGGRLAVRDAAGGLRVCDVASGKELWRADAGRRLRRPGFTPDGKFVIGDVPRNGLVPEALLLLDAADGQVKGKISLSQLVEAGAPSSPLTDLAVSSDGRVLATSHADHFVRVWDPPRFRIEQTFLTPRVEDHGVRAAAFSPDGRWLAGAGGDGMLRVWELATGEEVLMRGGGTALASVRFAPGGALIATASEGSVLLWSPRPEPWAAFSPAEAYVGDLASREGRWGYRAVTILAERPDETVPLLRKKLPPQTALAVDQLITQLGAVRQQEREAAERELAMHGADLVPFFEKAAERPDSREKQVRLRRLIEKSWSAAADRELLVARAIQVLELSGTPDALALLREYATGTSGTRLTDGAKAALARLESRK